MDCKFDYLFVVGDNNAGKSTFAAELGAALGLKVGETSRLIDEPLANVLVARPGAAFQHVAQMLEWIHLPQHKDVFRAAKRAMGDELLRVNPAYLVQKCVDDGARIITGMRRASEVSEFLATIPGGKTAMMFILYRFDADDPAIKPLTEFLAIPIANDEVFNDGSVEQLRAGARAWANAISIPA